MISPHYRIFASSLLLTAAYSRSHGVQWQYFIDLLKASLLRIPPTSCHHRTLWEHSHMYILWFLYSVLWEQNRWAGQCIPAKLNSVTPVYTPKGCDLCGDHCGARCCLFPTFMPVHFQIHRLVDAKWWTDSFNVKFSNYYWAWTYFSRLVSLWVSSLCELPLHVLCLCIYCVFLF